MICFCDTTNATICGFGNGRVAIKFKGTNDDYFWGTPFSDKPMHPEAVQRDMENH